jgi:hypothetical protein
MNVFQIALLVAIATTVAASVVLGRRGSLPRGIAAILVAGCSLGAVFVIEPDWATGVARLLGIGRGTDLVLYLLVLATSWGFLSMYMRLRAVRRDMTVLVRRMALDDADRDQRPGNTQRIDPV